MSWFFKRRKEAEQASLVTALTQAFAQALTGVLAAQTTQIETSSKFLGTLQDLSARKAAQVLGSRGGRESQKRKKAARLAPGERPACPLCANPFRQDVTLEMIAHHRLHGEASQDSPPEQPPEQGN